MEFTTIKVPAPMEIGDVNAYLVHGDRPTLIDAGPADEAAFEALRDGIEATGLDIEEIEQVLLTHPHSDHFGNAARVRALADAEVMMRQAAADIVEDFPSHKQRQMAFFVPYLERNGMPEGKPAELLEYALPNSYDTALEVDRVLEDGDRVQVDDTEGLEVLATRGHAHGSACFLDRSAGRAFTGDHILPEITPNPMLMLPRDGGDRPPSSLTIYLESLRAFPVEAVPEGHGGHGGPIPDLGSRIPEILEHHRQRKERVAAILDGEMTAFAVMRQLFPDTEESQWFLGMSEAIAHLRLLEDEGAVERLAGETIRYRPA